jgi:hypothetical protein
VIWVIKLAALGLFEIITTRMAKYKDNKLGIVLKGTFCIPGRGLYYGTTII